MIALFTFVGHFINVGLGNDYLTVYLIAIQSSVPKEIPF